MSLIMHQLIEHPPKIILSLGSVCGANYPQHSYGQKNLKLYAAVNFSSEKIMKRVFALAMASLISACSGGDGLMDEIMQSWEGAELEQVVSQWGYPDAQQEFGSNKIYIWKRDRTLSMPMTANTTGYVSSYGTYTGTTTYSGGGVSSWNCDRILEVNANDEIVGTQWKGNNCPFAEVAYAKGWRKQ